jgi:hypothetical protein
LENSYGRNDLAAHESADWAAAKGCMPIPLTQWKNGQGNNWFQH